MHLETDIGGDTDDLCALAMLVGWPGVELVGVTTVATRPAFEQGSPAARCGSPDGMTYWLSPVRTALARGLS